jgi:hypothetical protein
VIHKADGRLCAHLGENLRALYQAVVEEALPESFAALLAALDCEEVSVETTFGSKLGEGRHCCRRSPGRRANMRGDQGE